MVQKSCGTVGGDTVTVIWQIDVVIAFVARA